MRRRRPPAITWCRAWVHTYKLPALITNCSNNYGPLQFPEKLLPLMINNAIAGKPLPVYGDGRQVRDWLFVVDHCRAIETVLEKGRIGETYNVGGGNQQANIDVVHMVCDLLDELVPESPHKPHRQLIRFVQDRPGHDRRYAIDARKLERELGWRAQETFATGLRKTVEWYLANKAMDGRSHIRRVSELGARELRPSRRGEEQPPPPRQVRDEGNHSRRRIRHPPSSRDASGFEATLAGVRQADDLLPALGADAGRHSRDSRDLHAPGHAPL